MKDGGFLMDEAKRIVVSTADLEAGWWEEFFRKHPWMQTLPKRIQNYFFYVEYPAYGSTSQIENADNFRMAALTDPKALADFQMRHDKDCCGSQEEIIEDENGKLWIVGFKSQSRSRRQRAK